jgi:DNA recombination protein RmuC
MASEILAAIAALGSIVACVLLLLVLRRAHDPERLRLLAEQGLAGQRAEGETTRAHLATAERALGGRLEAMRADTQAALNALTLASTREQGEGRVLLETKLREMADASALRLGEIQRSVNEQLHAAVEKQMETSFQRVLDQFAAVQKAMGDVAATAAQIGDLKRIFGNVKSRGGWGETQLRALLDDILPAGTYEMNRKLGDDSNEIVEFAVRMPMRGEQCPVLAIDAKFPTEDYERLLDATEAGDAEAERAARRALEARVRGEARKIAEKYIRPPVTVEFAALYLPTDGLYAEIARAPGLIETISRECRVLVMGPSLLPALLRTIQLGFVTLALEQKADEVRRLLGATKSEMVKMDDVLEKLGKQAGTFSSTIERARVRTRAVGRKLRAVEALETGQAEAMLELDAPSEMVDDDEPGALAPLTAPAPRAD